MKKSEIYKLLQYKRYQIIGIYIMKKKSIYKLLQ